jgi:hypothetical protein
MKEAGVKASSFAACGSNEVKLEKRWRGSEREVLRNKFGAS